MTLTRQLATIVTIGAGVILLSAAAPAQAVKIGFQMPVEKARVSAGANIYLGNGLSYGGPVRGIRSIVYGRYPAPSTMRWVPGRYETVARQVWVDGCWRDVWVDAVYEYARDACGNLIKVCVRQGYWTRVQDAGYYETRQVQVWVDGRWMNC